MMKLDGIEIEVIRKPIKNLNLRVYPPDGKVRLSVPLRTKIEIIEGFLRDKKDWILKQQDQFKRKAANVKPALEYGPGEQLLLWGVPYQLTLQAGAGKRGRIWTSDNKIVMEVPPEWTKEQRGALVKEWYRQELKKQIPNLLLKWQPVVGVSIQEWGVKDMRTRWGTCNIQARRIWLNLRLAEKPFPCLEYVLVHELVHLLEKGHNAVFWGYMDRFFPDWKVVRKQLNQS